MRVLYQACAPQQPSADPTVVYEQATPVKWCCADMAREWGQLVGFGVKGHPRTTDHGVNVFTLHPQTAGSVIPGITPIAFCPWCGEAIEACRSK